MGGAECGAALPWVTGGQWFTESQGHLITVARTPPVHFAHQRCVTSIHPTKRHARATLPSPAGRVDGRLVRSVGQRNATAPTVFISSSRRPLLISLVAVIVGVGCVIAVAQQAHTTLRDDVGPKVTTVKP